MDKEGIEPMCEYNTGAEGHLVRRAQESSIAPRRMYRFRMLATPSPRRRLVWWRLQARGSLGERNVHCLVLRVTAG